MYVILGPFGTPTDLVSSIIDNKQIDLYTDGFYIVMSEARRNILTGDLTDSSRDLLQEINDASKIYNAIATTIQKRKLEPTSRTHTYISIDCVGKKENEWIYRDFLEPNI